MKTRRFGNNDSFRHRIGSLGSTYLVETVRPSYCKSRLCKDYRFVEYFIVDRFLTARRFHCHHQKRIQLNFNTLYWDNYIKNVKCTLDRHWGSVQVVRPMGGVQVYLYTFSNTALEAGEGSAPRPGRFYPREKLGTHCTGGWVGTRTGLDRCGKSGPHRDSIPGPPRP